MAEFNGHKNWNHWNVSLWLNNEEGLYRMLQHYRKFNDGAERMLNELHACGIYKTPDGAPYSKTTIKAAMRDM